MPIRTNPWFHRLILLSLFAGGVAVLFLLDRFHRHELQQEEERHLAAAVEETQRQITRSMAIRIQAVEDLGTFMLTHESGLPPSQAFDEFGANLMDHHPALDGVSFADTNRIIRHIHPLERHTKAVGLDLTKHPSADFIELAILNRHTTVDNPHQILSGHMAVVVRVPLFKGERFMGLAQGAIKIGAAVHEDLSHLEPYYRIQLHDRNGHHFWGEDLSASDEARTAAVSVGDNAWLLTMAPRTPAVQVGTFGRVLIWTVGGALLLALLAVFHRDRLYKLGLDAAIEEKTFELQVRNAELEQEISQRIEVERALQESEHKYRAVIETASDGIVLAEPGGRLREANPRFQAISGYSEAELVRMHAWELHPESETAGIKADFGDIRSQRSVHTERPLIRKDGEVMQVEIHATLLQLEDQELLLGVFRDITERKQAEQELQRYRHHLEQVVAKRTEELTLVNRELEAFSYSVSHDLRAPLRAINGFGEALREDCGSQLDDTAKDYLKRIRSSTERMSKLIDDLLKLSRTMRARPKQERVELTAMASEIIQELAATSPERRYQFVVAPDLVAEGDATLLHSVLANLLGNAWKFSHEQETTIIEFGVEEQGDERAFFVRDNGIGFDPRYVRNLFQPFQRLHRHCEYEGSGIGLATVQRIIHRHGGRIWAESLPDRGATFWFTLGSVDRDQ